MTGDKTKEQNLLFLSIREAPKKGTKPLGKHKSSKRQQDHGFEIKIHTQTKKEWKKKRRNEEQSYKWGPGGWDFLQNKTNFPVNLWGTKKENKNQKSDKRQQDTYWEFSWLRFKMK